MNPIKSIKNYMDDRFRKKLDKYFLEGGSTYMKPNVLYSSLINRMNTDKEFSKLLFEQIVWYQSNPDALRYFYTHEIGKYLSGIYDNRTDYFWSQKGEDVIRRTSGLVPLIAETYANLLFNTGYEYEIANGTEEDYDRLKTILKKNDFNNMIKELAETESYAGYGCVKMIIDEEVDNHPILEVVPPENVEVVTKYGRIVEIIFKKHFLRSLGDKKEEQYELHERYRDGSIVYALYEVKKNKQGKFEYREVPLTAFEDTKDLKDVEISDGTMLAFFKKNKASSHHFRGSVYSESDIASSLSLFDSIDETLSLLVTEQRDGKLTRFISQDLIPVDAESGLQSSKFSTFKNYIVLAGQYSQDGERPLHFEKPDTNVAQYLETLKQLTEKAINNAGLSPITCGISGFESKDSSDKSQREREKVSLRSRNNKLELYKDYMEDLFESILRVDDMMNGRKPKDYEVNVSFNDYVQSSIENRIDTVVTGLTGGVLSIEKAIDLLHGDDMSDEDKQLEVILVKLQNQIDTFTQEELDLMVKYSFNVETEEENIENEENLEENIEQYNI